VKPSFLFLFLSATLAFEGEFVVEPPVPVNPLDAAKQAKASFERGDYRGAESIYEAILRELPNDLNALSNLGVVRFRAGKLKLSEKALRRAIAVEPADGFSHCTLGIVYYSQARYDDAVNALTKALAINPKNATAHRYLGIVAAQKGWHDAAWKELQAAETLEPSPEMETNPNLGDFLTPLEKSRLLLPSAKK
jgi:tetratricopeptide (TPR) repeat protein